MAPLHIVLPLAAAALLGAGAGYAAEAKFPAKPLRVIVPFAPGGGTDLTTRLLATRLTESLGQPIVVDNRPGAGTMLGTELAARAPADGYTLLIAAAAHAINPSLHRKVAYHPIDDFSPVTMALAFPYVLVVPPSLPARTVKELIAYAKGQPGKVTFASSGTGNSNHLAGELFRKMAAIDITHVPYKGGGPALNDLLGGQVSMMFATVLETMPQVRAGRLRGLAVSGPKRAGFAPELPTVAEAALPGFQMTGWYAYLAPAKTPAPVVELLNREFVRALGHETVRGRLVEMGGEPWPTTPAEAAAFIREEVVRATQLIRDSGLKPE